MIQQTVLLYSIYLHTYVRCFQIMNILQDSSRCFLIYNKPRNVGSFLYLGYTMVMWLSAVNQIELHCLRFD